LEEREAEARLNGSRAVAVTFGASMITFQEMRRQIISKCLLIWGWREGRKRRTKKRKEKKREEKRSEGERGKYYNTQVKLPEDLGRRRCAHSSFTFTS